VSLVVRRQFHTCRIALQESDTRKKKTPACARDRQDEATGGHGKVTGQGIARLQWGGGGRHNTRNRSGVGRHTNKMILMY
jgi:hypothetical protein